MNRRAFAGHAALARLALGSTAGRPRPRAQGSIRVNGARLNDHLTALGRIGRNPETGGINRLAFSDADREARQFVSGLMGAAGLRTTVDAAGNLIGRRSGRDPSLPPLMLGSHIDSVPEGGNYDGPVGSLAAIEVAHALAEHNAATRHPLEVVVFSNEEGGKTGSRALGGEVESRELDLVTASGKTIGEGLRYIGGNPEQLSRVRRERNSIAAFLELHVEQGGVLERSGIDIGVVLGIVGIKRWNVTVTGFANHAGTTPMDTRQDALLAAGRFIDLVHRTARQTPGSQVATVGRIAAEPGVPNVIPGRVTLSLEVRDLDDAKIDDVFRAIERGAENVGRETATTFGFDLFYTSHAAPTEERLRRLIEESAAGLRLSSQRMPSGAGHDAQSLAPLAPVAMIFVPSVGGISHSPRELTHPEDITAGANALLHTVLKADQ